MVYPTHLKLVYHDKPSLNEIMVYHGLLMDYGLSNSLKKT